MVVRPVPPKSRQFDSRTLKEISEVSLEREPKLKSMKVVKSLERLIPKLHPLFLEEKKI